MTRKSRTCVWISAVLVLLLISSGFLLAAVMVSDWFRLTCGGESLTKIGLWRYCVGDATAVAPGGQEACISINDHWFVSASNNPSKSVKS